MTTEEPTGPAPEDPWGQQRRAMGAFIRHQRELANLSLRQMSQATKVSNAYLSQIERGMHDPTVRVLLQIGDVLDVSLEDMLQKTQHVEDAQESILTVEAAIAADTVLTQAEKQALLGVYRSYVAAHAAAETSQAPKRAWRRGDDHIS